ncbi:MAG: glycosyltransferase [Thiobacillaceae bacterium]
MARILFAWELGADLGHLNRILAVARALQGKGHVIFLAVRDMSNIQRVINPSDPFLWFQAPLWLPPLRNQPAAVSYAEILFFTGFLDPAGLLGLVRGWHALFAAIKPDLLVCDHAPVSLLSARAAPFKRITLGSGFLHPPRLAPLPVFRTWEEVDPSRVSEAEERVLSSANRVLQIMGQAPLQHLYQLFDIDRCLLTTWPELDHYANRESDGHEEYVGPITPTDAGAKPNWPDGGGRRIFAYLKEEHGAINSILQALSGGRDRVLAYVLGLADQQLRQYASPQLLVSTQPICYQEALGSADAVICHGGMGTVSSALLAGKPVLTLPLHSEQRITGERVAALGCGICLVQPQVEAEIGDAISQLVGNVALRRQAERFRSSHRNFSFDAAVGRVVEVVETLVA